ncbi:uncharacterized protein LOC121792535 [Salvia splendens]|uniref:uncharacterized protein LOC121792535 n=1 Tax=Salvia splendens TaxID=180675 RepID=UPI001C276F93|nr:uncharacterized protein LOC121792535 [Salvia splendens]
MDEPKPVPQSRKRPLPHSPYYKMRQLLKDLRPHFIDVLKTPDFRNCQAADEIRQGMKLLMELILYQETTEKAVKLEKCSNSDNVDAKKAVKPVDNPLLDDVMSALPPETQEQRTVIIGGSAFGWNFITCHGRRAVYYGRTKEAFRALNPKSS